MGKKGYLLCRNVENHSKSKLTNWRFPRVVGTIHFKRAPSKFSINLKSKIKTFKNSLNLDWKEKKTYEPKPPNMICQWREDSSHQTKTVPPWRPPFWIWFIIHLLPFPGLSSLCSPWQALGSGRRSSWTDTTATIPYIRGSWKVRRLNRAFLRRTS